MRNTYGCGMSTDTSNWANLDTSDSYAAGKGYSRAGHVFRGDPFVQMLAKPVIDSLLAAIFSPDGHGIAEGEHLRSVEPDEVRQAVRNVFAMSPLALVNDAFIEHVATLTATAITPQPLTV